jgi:hypothetical protein
MKFQKNNNSSVLLQGLALNLIEALEVGAAVEEIHQKVYPTGHCLSSCSYLCVMICVYLTVHLEFYTQNIRIQVSLQCPLDTIITSSVGGAHR